MLCLLLLPLEGALTTLSWQHRYHHHFLLLLLRLHLHLYLHYFVGVVLVGATLAAAVRIAALMSVGSAVV